MCLFVGAGHVWNVNEGIRGGKIVSSCFFVIPTFFLSTEARLKLFVGFTLRKANMEIATALETGLARRRRTRSLSMCESLLSPSLSLSCINTDVHCTPIIYIYTVYLQRCVCV